jgi:peptidoglycan/LPS O-acetylase OafA/YrhL
LRLDISSAPFITWATAHNTFLQFYNPPFLKDFGIGTLNGSLWTITVELQFYILIPLLYFAVSRWTRQVNNFLLVLIILVFIVVNQHYLLAVSQGETMHTVLFAVSFAPWLYMFLMGVLIQQNFQRLRFLFEGRLFAWLSLYVSSGLMMHYGFNFTVGGNFSNPVSVVLLSGVVIAFAFSFRRAGEILRGQDLSYGLYLYHMPVLNVLAELQILGSIITMVIGFGMTLLLALFSWNVIEKNALKLKPASRIAGVKLDQVAGGTGGSTLRVQE